jgi:GTPase SAR1 family protein
MVDRLQLKSWACIPMSEDAPKYKVVFVGDAQAGKTSLIHSYLKQDVDPVATLDATSTRVEAIVDDTTILSTSGALPDKSAFAISSLSLRKARTLQLLSLI